MTEGRFKTDRLKNILDELVVFSGKSGDCATFGTQLHENDTASSEIYGVHVYQYARN